MAAFSIMVIIVYYQKIVSEIKEVLVKRELNWFKHNFHQLKAITVMKVWKVDNRMFIDNERLV
jgi:hypothetical protein